MTTCFGDVYRLLAVYYTLESFSTYISAHPSLDFIFNFLLFLFYYYPRNVSKKAIYRNKMALSRYNKTTADYLVSAIITGLRN